MLNGGVNLHQLVGNKMNKRSSMSRECGFTQKRINIFQVENMDSEDHGKYDHMIINDPGSMKLGLPTDPQLPKFALQSAPGSIFFSS